ncbi:hypothetical protein [Tsuneonella sp. HG222]
MALTKIIVRGQNAWGKGDTLHEAFTKARDHTSYTAKGHLIKAPINTPAYEAFAVSEGSYVSDMGGITYPLAEEAPVALGCLNRLGKPVPNPE